MNSNKKIEKLDTRELPDFASIGKLLAELHIKLNLVIDKVNELEEYRNSKKHYEYENGQWVERTKLKSQPEECEHDFSCAMSDYRKEHIECNKCKVPNPKKQIIYTSEGDAVGEVEKRCEHKTVRPEARSVCVSCGEVI
jgi:ribosomal protein L11 methylase PrmA